MHQVRQSFHYGYPNLKIMTCEVEPFCPTDGTAKQVRIVDAKIVYDF